jgi:hypothetical protein
LTHAARTTQVYAFHGLRIGCTSGSAVAQALHSRLGRFPASAEGVCDLVFEYRTETPGDTPSTPAAPSSCRPVYDSDIGEVLYDEETDRMYVSCLDRMRVECDPAGGKTTVAISGAVDEHLWLLSHPLFTLPLIESLKRRGLFSLHAAGVAVDGKVILFPGSSGSGKSTLALALLREGFAFLGDDMLFLSPRNDALTALAFPEAIDLTDDTARLFPELQDVFRGPRPIGWPKRQLRAEERYGVPIAWSGRPALLVFPRVSRDGRSSLERMDASDALLELAPNILLTEPKAAQAHLDALAGLVSMCGCYRLETGLDFARLAAELRGLPELSA